jgi:hypothetical protein
MEEGTQVAREFILQFTWGLPSATLGNSGSLGPSFSCLDQLYVQGCRDGGYNMRIPQSLCSRKIKVSRQRAVIELSSVGSLSSLYSGRKESCL